MATLEKIIYNQDTGTEAIQKLDRNQRKINDDVKIINMDGVNQQITDLVSRDVAQQQQINTLSSKLSNLESISQQIDDLNGSKSLADYYDLDDFMIDGKYSFNGTCLNLPSMSITDGYVEFTPYGGNSNYGQQEVLGFATNGKQYKYFRLLNNGVWQPWQQIATLSQIKKTVSDFSTISDEVLVQSTINMAAGSTVYLKLPERYVGILTIYSHVKGEYYESYFVQLTNKYSYHFEKLCENRFNNAASEIYSEFAYGNDIANVLLCIHNNTALSGNFSVTLTQNLRGDV